jgi:RES domain-containing protein
VTIDVARLPRKILRPGACLYRIHRAGSNPWFFDGSGAGRFDPTGSPGRAACYWAEDALGAWVEVFRTRMLLPELELAERAISVATLSEDLVVVDLTVRRGLKAGVTAALTAGGDYTEAHALADALQAEHPGVRWRLRHDLRQKLIGVAWFGDAGGADSPTLPALPRTETAPIASVLVEPACRIFGYVVLPQPPA